MDTHSTVGRLIVLSLLVWAGSLQAAGTSEITLIVSPANSGGVVEGGGAYLNGSSATVTASSSNSCDVFESWSVGGKIITENPYTFPVTKSETVTANFATLEYTIAASSAPSIGGLVAGTGKKACDSTATLMAIHKTGFVFENWTSSEGLTITNNPYKFTVTTNDTFFAHFKDIQAPLVRITAPGPNEHIPAAAYILEESASDNVGVVAVSNNLNGAGWQAASYFAEFNIWFQYATLVPNRTNSLTSVSVDAAGNVSIPRTVNFICTASGLAPVSIVDQLAVMSMGTNPINTSFLSLDSVGYVNWYSYTNNQSEVGTYTYTPTGPDTAEVVLHPVLPTQEAASNNAVMEWTFTDAYNVNFTNSSGSNGTIYIGDSVQTVPADLDGFVVTLTNFFGTFRSTNSFTSASFASADNLQGDSGGTYTFTPFTQLDALLVETYTNPVSILGSTNYIILTFTEYASPASGYYSSEIRDSAGLISLDTGRFTTATQKVTSVFKGPATLEAWQAQVTPAAPHSPTFTRSFGKGTYASISPTNTEPTDVGFILGNDHITANTGNSTLLALTSPLALAEDEGTVDMTWKTATSVLASNVVSGNTAEMSFRKSPTNVPPTLSGHTITLPAGKNSSEFSFVYKNITGGGADAGLSGTYTYAPYTPVMALVTITATNGEIQYLQLYFTSLSSGSYVRTESDPINPGNWTFKSGTFTMK
jgi:uncharacterized repeat protein (TIGR02543 family)